MFIGSINTNLPLHFHFTSFFLSVSRGPRAIRRMKAVTSLSYLKVPLHVRVLSLSTLPCTSLLCPNCSELRLLFPSTCTPAVRITSAPCDTAAMAPSSFPLPPLPPFCPPPPTIHQDSCDPRKLFHPPSPLPPPPPLMTPPPSYAWPSPSSSPLPPPH